MTVHETPWLEIDDVACVSLRNVFLHVTKACNLNCAYCYFSARRPMADEMTTEQFAALWPQLVALNPDKVVFTGGEPLVRGDLFELLEGLKLADAMHRIKRCVNTNGHLVTPEVATRLVGLADEVRVSLDGIGPTNDALRGSGNFDAAMRALNYLLEVGFEPKVLMTITAHNVNGLEELICYLFRNNFTRLSFNNFRPIGRGENQWEWRANPESIRQALKRAWHRCYPHRAVPEQVTEQDQKCHCGVGTMLNILPNGDVFPCHVLTHDEFRCGNVREKNLLEICRASGMLGDLANLDFKQLARTDSELSDLARPGECLGNVYARTSESTVWLESLPILQTQNVRTSSSSPD
ncbi:MAG: radical SAM protein [Planctomycetaceae bacterium]